MTARLKPAVNRRWLFGLAGVAWSIAGLILLSWTIRWLWGMPLEPKIGLGILGAAAAFLAVRYMFAQLVQRNITRIEDGPDRACAFSFLAWKSYGIMFAMMAMGIVLRHSATPREVLAPMYGAMGGALLGASLPYFKRFIDEGRLAARPE